MKCALAIGAALVVAVPIMSLSASPAQAPGGSRVALDLSGLDARGEGNSAAQGERVRAVTVEGMAALAGLSG
jgi:hypothetical protein